jgi:hypothetical protein
MLKLNGRCTLTSRGSWIPLDGCCNGYHAGICQFDSEMESTCTCSRPPVKANDGGKMVLDDPRKSYEEKERITKKRATK